VRRYINQQPVRVGRFENAVKMIKPFMNGGKVHWNDSELQLTWVRTELPPIEMHVAGYGPKVLAIAGRHGDGVIIQLADHLGVEGGRITPSQLVDMTSTTIARRFGLTRKGSIAPGFDADIVVFDTATPFEFSTRTSQMNVDYDLFEGQSSTGSVRHTLCRGTMVYDRGEIVTQPGHGRFVPRSLGARAAVAS